MRDYSNMPKIDWNDDKATLSRIKAQIMHEEPVILLIPENFNFDLDPDVCDYQEKSSLLIGCAPDTALSILAKQNAIPALNDIGSAAKMAGMVIDVDSSNHRLIIHD